MSTEFYVVCEKHKHISWACSDGFSGPMLQCGWYMAGFLISHRNCSLSVIDEHELDNILDNSGAEEIEEIYLEWNKENWKQIMTYEGPITFKQEEQNNDDKIRACKSSCEN